METTNKVLSQAQIEKIVGENIKTAMDWEFFVMVAILILPIFILTVAGIYVGMHVLLKLGLWVVLYITYFKCEKWVIERKVRHTVEKLREASE